MIDFSEYYEVATNIYNTLDIPESSYMSRRGVKNLEKSFLRDPKVISELVDQELANYDFSENTEGEYAEFRKAVIDELQYMIGETTEKYYAHNQQITEHVYSDIIHVLETAPIDNVIGVDAEYEPADPSVGIYSEERVISISLSNGVIINLNVEIDDSGL